MFAATRAWVTFVGFTYFCARVLVVSLCGLFINCAFAVFLDCGLLNCVVVCVGCIACFELDFLLIILLY